MPKPRTSPYVSKKPEAKSLKGQNLFRGPFLPVAARLAVCIYKCAIFKITYHSKQINRTAALNLFNWEVAHDGNIAPLLPEITS